MYILKYLLIAVILYVVMRPMKLDDTRVAMIILVILAGMWTYDNMIEPMNGGSCGYKVPRPYNLSDIDQDHLQSGLRYDHKIPIQRSIAQFSTESIPMECVRKEMEKQRYNKPGYYLFNDCQYSSTGIPYEKVAEIMAKSKIHDLYNQHNHNITWSPHTHIGKARGRMNWEQTQ